MAPAPLAVVYLDGFTPNKTSSAKYHEQKNDSQKGLSPAHVLHFALIKQAADATEC
jgi:hypothetical protein